MALWEANFNVYMANVGGAPTSFVVDLGAAPHAPVATHPQRIQVRVKLRRPLPNGLRDASELEAMGAVEDTIVARAEADVSAVYVGRTLGEGYTTFFFYAPAGDVRQKLREGLSDLGDYTAEWLTEDDAEWSCYLDFLYPDTIALEQMSNRAQLEQRAKIGDKLEAPREIDHFAIFRSHDLALRASDALKEAGFRVGSVEARPEDKGFSLEFHKVSALDGGSANKFCAEIRALLAPFDGSYDGWGAVVVKDPPD